jgi:alkanesulfonate monooxygenase SsuD/methylene tetrahydromethanopterin reductase-like flavin-dependent oxidoreductase (luciferase family)
MKVSIFCEHILPRPWAEDSEYNRLQQSLEQFELADALGFHAVWMTEHHFLEEYCHSTAPEVFLAAVSQRTKNLRLGHGIVQMLPKINHPARVAERLAVLDLVSNGRVEFGTGEGSSATELDGFVLDPGKKRPMWTEGMQVAIRCMTETPFTGFQGEHLSMPPRNVVPKPRQKPHPPLWVACTRQETITFAGENGMGALSFSFAGPEKFAERVVQYYEALERCVPIGRAVNANILASAGQLMCAPDDEKAMQMIGNTGGFFGFGIAHYYVQGGHQPGRTNLWELYEKMLVENPASVDQARMGGVGSPQKIREYMRRFEDIGVDQMMFLLPPVPHERIMESLERFGKEVLPEFIERDAAAAAAKAKRLEPVIDAAMSRRVDDTPALDPDYEISGVPVSWDGLQVTEIIDTLAKLEADRKEVEEAARR